MKRRISPARGLFAGGGVALAVAGVLAGFVIAPDLSDASTGSGAPPTTLNRIAQQNDRAASEAAMRLREQSRRQAERADALRAAEERGRAKADAMMALYDDAEAAPVAGTR